MREADARAIADYLSSDRAVADAAAILAREPSEHIPHVDESGYVHWFHIVDGAWRSVQVGRWTARPPWGVRAFYRTDGDRIIVSDLGESVHELRRRTGWDGDAAKFEPWEAIERATEGTRFAAEGRVFVMTVAADLPRAVCRVLLAADRVARLMVG